MLRIRLAGAADLEGLYRLDASIFRSEETPAVEAVAGEFEQGVSEGEVYLAEVDGEPVGFAHVEHVADRCLFLASLGVVATHRGGGIGAALLRTALERAVAGGHVLETATDPRNAPMIGLLTSLGFLVTEYVEDYYGPGRHRFLLSADPDFGSRPVLDRVLIPAESPANRSRVGMPEWFIRRAVKVGARLYYEHVRLGDSERRFLQPEEASGGIAFSGTMLAALTFLLGFALASSRLSNDVRLILGAAVVVSLLSALVYANALGELARLDHTRFTRHMEVGNIMSEYGGIIPLLVVVPVALAAVVDSWPGRFSIGTVGTLLLGGYLASSFALWRRYHIRPWQLPLLLVVALAPLAWVVLEWMAIHDLVWALSVVGALGIGYAVLYFSSGEAVERRQRERIRA